jgi:hypothetical protein
LENFSNACMLAPGDLVRISCNSRDFRINEF